MNKKVVRIWTDVEVDANTEDGAIMAAAAQVLADDVASGTKTVEWNFFVAMSEEDYNELMGDFEKIAAEGVETVEKVEDDKPQA